MLCRIWDEEHKQMVVDHDVKNYLIGIDGLVYCLLPERLAAMSGPVDWDSMSYAMMGTDYVWEKGDDKILYEFDIVECDDELGLVYFDDCAFKIYFPWDGESEWLANVKVTFMTHYFAIRNNPAWRNFVESIPVALKPDIYWCREEG